MIDKLITFLMNKYLNEFIENVDPKELGASLYSGSLELKNMQLKTTMFNKSPLPFLLQAGQVGRIYFKRPEIGLAFNRYGLKITSPLIIEIEDVFGLVKMKPVADWNE